MEVVVSMLERFPCWKECIVQKMFLRQVCRSLDGANAEMHEENNRCQWPFLTGGHGSGHGMERARSVRIAQHDDRRKPAAAGSNLYCFMG